MDWLNSIGDFLGFDKGGFGFDGVSSSADLSFGNLGNSLSGLASSAWQGTKNLGDYLGVDGSFGYQGTWDSGTGTSMFGSPSTTTGLTNEDDRMKVSYATEATNKAKEAEKLLSNPSGTFSMLDQYSKPIGVGLAAWQAYNQNKQANDYMDYVKSRAAAEEAKEKEMGVNMANAATSSAFR